MKCVTHTKCSPPITWSYRRGASYRLWQKVGGVWFLSVVVTACVSVACDWSGTCMSWMNLTSPFTCACLSCSATPPTITVPYIVLYSNFSLLVCSWGLQESGQSSDAFLWGLQCFGLFLCLECGNGRSMSCIRIEYGAMFVVYQSNGMFVFCSVWISGNIHQYVHVLCDILMYSWMCDDVRVHANGQTPMDLH